MMDAVVKELWIPVSQEVAFRRFTSEISDWWPMATHSVSLDNCREVRFLLDHDHGPNQPAGVIEEVAADGTTHTWGALKSWNPPHGLVMNWHPGRGPEEAQEIEITFQLEGEGTRVRLTHRGWEALGEGAEEIRGRYDEGWIGVLQLFGNSA